MQSNKLKNIVKSIYGAAYIRMSIIDSVCKKGCSYCCCQIPCIHEAEGLVVSDYIGHNLTEQDKEYLKQKVNQWLDCFMAHTPDRALGMPDIIAFEKLAAQKQIYCPFLKNNLCLIYDARPLACRTFSVNDSAETCEREPNRNCDPEAYNLRSYLIDKIKVETGSNSFCPLAYTVANALDIKRELKNLSRSVNWQETVLRV